MLAPALRFIPICSPARRSSAMWRGMNVSFRDMLFLLVFAYLVVGALALAHVAKTDEEQSKGQTPPGNVIVEMFWDKAIDADVDLWVQAPGRRAGRLFEQVRR